MASRLGVFTIWALVAASVVFWAMRLLLTAMPVPTHASNAGPVVSPEVDLTRLFGESNEVTTATAEPEPEPPPVARFRLTGVMAPRHSAEGSRASAGLALIAVDDDPAKPYRVGQRVAPDLVLREVKHRTATVGPANGGDAMVLQMPPLPPPEKGAPTRAAEVDGLPAAAAPAGVAQDAADRAAERAAARRARRARPAAVAASAVGGETVQQTNQAPVPPAQPQ